MGLASATFFAFAAVGFRGAVTRMATPSIAMAATTMLVAGLAVQTAVLLVWLALFDRAGLKAILEAVARVAARRLHGRAGVAIVVRRLRAHRRGAGAHAGAGRSAVRPGASLRLFRERPSRANGSAWR